MPSWRAERRVEGADCKKALWPPDRRAAAKYLNEEQGLEVNRSCQCVGLSRSTYYRAPVNWLVRDQRVIDTLKGLTEEFSRLGF